MARDVASRMTRLDRQKSAGAQFVPHCASDADWRPYMSEILCKWRISSVEELQALISGTFAKLLASPVMLDMLSLNLQPAVSEVVPCQVS